jgi:hypothetical protein
MDKEENKNSEYMLTHEPEPTPAQLEEGKEKENILNFGEDDDFRGYSRTSKYLLFFLFFWLGIINHLGTILVMNGGRLLAFELNMSEYLQIYTSVATIFSILTRVINSKLCLKVSYKKRIFILSFWMMAGYLSMYAILELHSTVLKGKKEYDTLCFILSFVPCFFLGSSYAFGEAAIIAYLRMFPKTLIAGWSSGTGLSGLISGCLNLTTQLVDGFSLKYLYLVLFPIGFVYLFLFICTFRILKAQERKIEREERLSRAHMSIMRDSSVSPTNNLVQQSQEEVGETVEEPKDGKMELVVENESEDPNKQKTADDKEMEDMNKANQVISCENFRRVMNMVGRVIINLGLIYFLQFFCTNTLIVIACNQKDIGFLPEGCSDSGKKFRRGKYEFINLFYQIGMFLSKTFIKIVRRIQPIEVYTIAILVINILYIIEYFGGFIPWGVYIPVGLILGFFSGGTYAGGFYTILNSDQVQKNFKELTVNIATIFNDTGTFLSGIIGYVFYNYVLTTTYPDMGKC